MLPNNSSKLTNGNDHNEAYTSFSKQFVDSFHIILPKIVDEALSKLSYMNSDRVKARIKDMTEYYSLEKRPMLGELMLCAYEILNGPIYPDERTHQQAYILACILELGVTHFLFIDDLEDGSKVRLGKTCWHLLPNVGLLATNDSTILRSLIHELFRQNFSGAVLLNMINYLNEIYFATAIGQHMDTELANKRNYDEYTEENYLSMTLNKQIFIITAPIVFALFLANKATDESIRQVQEICKDIAVLLQIQNDVMDLNCDGLKSCTDIPKAKCSWLAFKTLEMCNAEQRNVFVKHYGSWDPSHIKIILDLYEELNLSELFIKEQRAKHESFLRKINQLPPNVIPGTEFYQKLFKLIVSFRI